MKNKIDVLFGQALDKAVPETWTTLDLRQLLKLKTEFAKLIIDHCTEQCDIEANRLLEIRKNTYEFSEKNRLAAKEYACVTVKDRIIDTLKVKND